MEKTKTKVGKLHLDHCLMNALALNVEQQWICAIYIEAKLKQAL